MRFTRDSGNGRGEENKSNYPTLRPKSGRKGRAPVVLCGRGRWLVACVVVDGDGTLEKGVVAGDNGDAALGNEVFLAVSFGVIADDGSLW